MRTPGDGSGGGRHAPVRGPGPPREASIPVSRGDVRLHQRSRPFRTLRRSHALALWRTLLEATGDGVLVVRRGTDGCSPPTLPSAVSSRSRTQAGTLTEVALGQLCERLGEAFADTAHFLGRAAELQREEGPVAGEMLDHERRPDARVRRAPGAGGRPTQRAALAVARRDRPRPPSLRRGPRGIRTTRTSRTWTSSPASTTAAASSVTPGTQLDAAALARRPMLLIFVDVDEPEGHQRPPRPRGGRPRAGGHREGAQVHLPRAGRGGAPRRGRVRGAGDRLVGGARPRTSSPASACGSRR